MRDVVDEERTERLSSSKSPGLIFAPPTRPVSRTPITTRQISHNTLPSRQPRALCSSLGHSLEKKK